MFLWKLGKYKHSLRLDILPFFYYAVQGYVRGISGQSTIQMQQGQKYLLSQFKCLSTANTLYKIWGSLDIS